MLEKFFIHVAYRLEIKKVKILESFLTALFRFEFIPEVLYTDLCTYLYAKNMKLNDRIYRISIANIYVGVPLYNHN